MVVLAVALALASAGCGESDGEFVLLLGETGATEKELEFEVSRISIGNGGGEWWTVLDLARVFVLEGGVASTVGRVQLEPGSFSQIKVELGPLFRITMEDSSVIERERPDLLMYLKDGAYLPAEEAHGFERSTRYFLFTVGNGMLSAPIDVESGATTGEVELQFEPRYPEVDSVGIRAALAARVEM